MSDAAIERDAEFIPNVSALWRGGYKSTVRRFFSRLEEVRGETLSHVAKDTLEERIDRVRDLRDFRFQVIELASIADEAQVAEIFVRINSKGIQLNQADFILTLMSVHWEEGRKALEEFCRSAVDPSHSGNSARNAYLDPTPDQMLRAAVGLAFRRGRMITSDNAVIFTYVLWLIGRYDFGLDIRKLRRIIGQWFFMAQTTTWYTSSPESVIESDLARLRSLSAGDGAGFIRTLEQTIASNLTNDYWSITLPSRLDTSSSYSPTLFAYWAALNLMDAELLFSTLRMRDLFDTGTAAPRAIERHHLFPKAMLARQSVTNPKQTNAIGNMAFLDWPDNASISDSDPTEYWPIFASNVDANRRRQQAYWHALPIGWEQLDYEVFLERRRGLMAKVVRDGFEKLAEKHGEHVGTTDLGTLLGAGESQLVEYKSTARYNLHTDKADKKMEYVIVKTVGGFLNSEGGKLLVGVADDSTVLGLDHDYRTLSKGNRDGFELALRQRLERSLSAPTAGTVRIGFDDYEGKDVCIVSVAPAGKPVFAKMPDTSGSPTEFWVRIGNATNQLHGDDVISYCGEHWG